MKKHYLVVIAFVAALAVSATIRARAGINVVTTTEDLASIVREVGGDKVTVEALAKGYQDPHFVEAKPSFVLKLHSADLLVVVGRELEIGWLPPLITQSRNAKIQPGGPGYLDASTTVRILDIPTGQVTRAMGDVHPQGNPHYWLDPRNGRLIAKAIQDKLTSSSARTTLPTSRSAMPTSIDGWPKARSAGRQPWRPTRARRSSPTIARGRTLPRSFDLDVVGYVEPKPGIPPSPAHQLDAHGGDEATEHQDHPRRAVLRSEDAEHDRARHRGQGPGDDAVGRRRQGSHELHTLFDYDVNLIVSALKGAGK